MRQLRDAMLLVKMDAEYVIQKGERFYLVPPFDRVFDGEEIKIEDRRFAEFVAKNVNNYLRGKEIPLDIQAPIINAAEEFLSGKNITFRAGDYITLQNHLNTLNKGIN